MLPCLLELFVVPNTQCSGARLLAHFIGLCSQVAKSGYSGGRLSCVRKRCPPGHLSSKALTTADRPSINEFRPRCNVQQLGYLIASRPGRHGVAVFPAALSLEGLSYWFPVNHNMDDASREKRKLRDVFAMSSNLLEHSSATRVLTLENALSFKPGFCHFGMLRLLKTRQKAMNKPPCISLRVLPR